jgi:hypothetical protein
MAATWTHPQLGTFEYDDDYGAWATTVKAPAFDAFKWEQEPTGSCGLLIDADDEDEVPSRAAVAVALKVLAAQAGLPKKVIAALWDDFNGRGGDSGMWWHGDLKEVAAHFGYDGRPAPRRPEDLLSAMDFLRIVVRKEADGYEKPVAELTFGAVFEEEHGVGVLTDGKDILGTGYMGEAAAFDSDPDDEDDDD